VFIPTCGNPVWLFFLFYRPLMQALLTPSFPEQNIPHRYTFAVLMEFVRSLFNHHLAVNPSIYELVINCLVTENRYDQLSQFLDYHIVRDSVHVACLLLSVEEKYPPAYQLAMDMLKRLQSSDQIVEVLLAKKDVMAVLKYLQADSNRKVTPAPLLEVALASGNNMVCRAVSFRSCHPC